MSSLHAVVPAAGVGARMGATIPKQYLPLLGEPMLARTLRRLLELPRLDALVVALGAEDGYWGDIDPALRARVQRADGGAERADSVLAGLRRLAQRAHPDDLVLVHDAARPCVRLDDLNALVAAVAADPANGGLLACPVRDTMKRADADGRVRHTEPRDGLWHALTPQLFPLQALIDAIECGIASGAALTDEASAMELAGRRPRLVPGSDDNLKVTRPGDLRLAEQILAGQLPAES